jgi:hypothetical protein
MPAAKVFPKANWERFAHQLDALPDRPASDRGLAVREAIGDIVSNIRAAQARGYSLEQIIELAKSSGIDISAGTLKLAMRRAGKRAAPSTDTNRPKAVQPVRAMRERSTPQTGQRTHQPTSNQTATWAPMAGGMTPTAGAPASASGTNAVTTRATFAIKPDTDDL